MMLELLANVPSVAHETERHTLGVRMLRDELEVGVSQDQRAQQQTRVVAVATDTERVNGVAEPKDLGHERAADDLAEPLRRGSDVPRSTSRGSPRTISKGG
jgi:hypothetical protein